MHNGVTTMATDSAVTVLFVAITLTVMCSNVIIAVTALSVVTTTTPVCTVRLQRFHCYRFQFTSV